ncbi:MAG: hypothetical protein VW999_08480 [Alphaproteobacteria bacterium]
MSAANADLRSALDGITNDRVLLKDHVPRIAALQGRYPHTIVAQPVDHTPGFNCFAFAFGLWDQPGYVRIAAAEHRAGESRFFASTAFAGALSRDGALIPVGRRDLTPGDVVLYGTVDKPIHAAQVLDPARVRSKWGRGHLYDHGLWEVPGRYGHTVRFYRAASDAPFLPWFERFVQAHPDWPDFADTHL